MAEAKQVVSDSKNKTSAAKAAKAEKDEDTIALEQELSLSLGMNVVIDGAGPSGELRISYKSLDQLDELLHKLSHGGGNHGGGVRLDQ